ncbi:MAG: AraC family transcriptional regulator, partial [Pseudomonadales bacterium]|nr:AraC family transcriptional regulator [Pseudomonadales bacterium]
MVSIDSFQNKLLYPTIPIGFLEDVFQAVRFKGVNVENLLSTNGLSQAALETPGMRVSIDIYSKVLRDLSRLTEDAFYGFLSKQIPAKAFEQCCYGLVGCRTMEECVKHANDFYSLFTSEFSWSLEKYRNDLTLTAHIEPMMSIDYRFIIQSLLLMAIRLF